MQPTHLVNSIFCSHAIKYYSRKTSGDKDRRIEIPMLSDARVPPNTNAQWCQGATSTKG